MANSIKRIKASDGTANASQATITQIRSALATTIHVDTVAGMYAGAEGFYATMGTPHTFTDPITGETITVISEASAVDFQGHIDTGNIIIDAIAPGYTDLGSKVGDIIVIRPTTQWANNIGDTLAVSLNDDGTLKNGAITTNSQFVTALDPVQRASDIMYDFVASGCVITADAAGSTLKWSMTAGVVYIGGKRVVVSAITSDTATASKDTYVDVDNTGTVTRTGGNIVANNAASPALAANSIRLGIIVSGASSIASGSGATDPINQGQETRALPIASSIPYTVTDSLGNLICPRDPQRKVLGYKQILTNATSTSNSQGAVSGLSCPVVIPANRKVKITIAAAGASNSSSGDYAVIGAWEGASSGTLTTQLGQWNINQGVANMQIGVGSVAIHTPASSGLNFYTAGLSRVSAGTVTLAAQAGQPASILVELV